MTINPQILTTLGILSIVTFVASLIIIPIIISRLPRDYFVSDSKKNFEIKKKNGLYYAAIQFAKNLFGILFILAGIAMLVLPGQGVLTILIGLGITNFPGKNKLERKLVANKQVFKSLNWIRKKADVDLFYSPLKEK